MLPKELFTLRVTVLEDATLLGFRVPHHLCDGQSAYDIVKAYAMLVAGRRISDLIPPPDIDVPLSSLVDKRASPSLSTEILDEKVPFLLPEDKLSLGFSAWLRYVGYAAAKMIGAKLGIKSQYSEEKYIHLPGTLVEQWQNECQEELDDSPTNKGIYLTKMDIISAWLLKVDFHHLFPPLLI